MSREVRQVVSKINMKVTCVLPKKAAHRNYYIYYTQQKCEIGIINLD